MSLKNGSGVKDGTREALPLSSTINQVNLGICSPSAISIEVLGIKHPFYQVWPGVPLPAERLVGLLRLSFNQLLSSFPQRAASPLRGSLGRLEHSRQRTGIPGTVQEGGCCNKHVEPVHRRCDV